MTLKLETHRDVQIYVDTLYSLARDARVQGDNAALKFIGGYLVNVVPPHLLETFRDELKRIEPSKPEWTGTSLKLDDSVPAKPAKTPRAPAVRQPVASTSW